MMKGLVAVGDVLGGKYRVDKILGIGGMGMVVAATHLELDQRVALKFMLPAATASAEASGRFLREARAAGRLSSDHVCRVMDVGRFEDGVPYIVMEYLQGENLAAVLRKRGPMSVPEAVDIILQATEGLAEAHAHGIIHRDLKPDNLFLHKRNDGGRIVKILDFGISKLTMGGAATGTGDIMGSPAYMAPEQMESSRNVDHRADVWSLGVVLYQLVCGRQPFQGDTLPLLCLHVVNDDPPPMSEIRGDLPDGFEAVVMKCLAKEPEHRFTDVGELAMALAPFGPKNSHISASRIQVVLRRQGKDSSMVIPLPAPASAVMLEDDRAAASARGPSVPHSTTLGATSGQSLATMRTDRPSRTFAALTVLVLGLVALVIGIVWPTGGKEVTLGQPPLAPAPAGSAARPAPIVEPIIEEPAPVAASGVGSGAATDPPEPTTASPGPAVAASGSAADTAASPDEAPPPRKTGRLTFKKRKPRRPGAPAGSGSAAIDPAAPSGSDPADSAGPAEEEEEEEDKWNHMTHDEKKP